MQLVLVTGASGGIGTAVVDELSKCAKLEVIGMTSEDCDFSNLNSLNSFFEDKRLKEVSAVILCAGVNKPQPLRDVTEGEFEKTMTINMLSHKKLLDFLLPNMVEKRFGRIVAISSLYSTRTRSGRWAYSASKAAMETLVRSISIEYASSNILANSVVPGFVDTPLTRKNNTPEEIRHLESRIPLGRLAAPFEIAKLAVYLASDENTYITGQSIFIDGGVSVL